MKTHQNSDLNRRFDYHRPDEEKARSHEAVRATCKELAYQLSETIPPGRELSLALTNLEQVMFWANAAIARSDNG